jgi:hypothetical protein
MLKPIARGDGRRPKGRGGERQPANRGVLSPGSRRDWSASRTFADLNKHTGPSSAGEQNVGLLRCSDHMNGN